MSSKSMTGIAAIAGFEEKMATEGTTGNATKSPIGIGRGPSVPASCSESVKSDFIFDREKNTYYRYKQLQMSVYDDSSASPKS